MDDVIMATEADRKLLASGIDLAYYNSQFHNHREIPEDPISHYLTVGWKLGLDPSPQFSTCFYLNVNADVKESGVNPFLHYLRYGRDEGRTCLPQVDRPTQRDVETTDRSMIHLANDYDILKNAMSLEFYKDKNPDLRAAAEQGIDLVDHFMNSGWKEGRDPNPEFSTSEYNEMNADVRASNENPFLHYLKYGRAEGRPPRRDANKTVERANTQSSRDEDYNLLKREMSLEFYRACNADLAEAEKGGLNLILHYLDTGWKEGRDPHPDFSTSSYLDINDDVRLAGQNPFIHYIRYGRLEGRQVRAISISNPEDVILLREVEKSDLEQYIWSGYEDVKKFGQVDHSERLQDLDILSFTNSVLARDFDQVAKGLHLGTDFDRESFDISIVIPCYDQLQYTLECLISISNSKTEELSYEVIIVDNGSKDDYSILSNVRGITLISLEKNEGFGSACNRGVAAARGEYVLILNNDTQMSPDFVRILFNELKHAGPGVQAVVPKVLSFDGLLQEAGCIVSNRCQGQLIGYGDDHRRPRYNYKRLLEYGSAVALLVKKAVFANLGGFDGVYSPAYYEDVDFCHRLRKSGGNILYIPSAVIAHHLSKTSNNMKELDWKAELVLKNKHSYQKRWQRELLARKIRLIAFYLPQYHPIPENDKWWGKGFTEWTNVVKARPNYVGHRQPRRHGDLGYYDLRSADTMDRQAELAKRYGIYGFCYYYYWFSGKRVLEMPIERILQTGKPDHPFCLCWANENWTRTWDGNNNDILLGQDYSEKSDLEVIKDLARYFRSENYIRIDGKPLILVYRVKSFPFFRRTSQVWRNYCRSIGEDEILIAAVESFELSARPEDPEKFGCDVTVEFPPHGMVHDPRVPVESVNPEFVGSVHNYRSLAKEYMSREEAGWRRFRSVLVGWDNTPRRQNASLVLEGSTPGAFQAWLEWTIERTMQQNYGDDRIIFVNAWNEWGEGSYLEPDGDYGHAYLQAVKYALDKFN